MEDKPQVKPLREIEGQQDPQILLMTFEALYRDKLVASPEGAGHRTPGEHDAGWIHGLRNLRLYDPAVELHGDFLAEVYSGPGDGGKPLFQAMFNLLPPRGYLDWHIDGPPYRERWHYIITGYTHYYQGRKPSIDMVQQKPGFWYGPISYWVPHAVNNNGIDDRIALLVDFGADEGITE